MHYTDDHIIDSATPIGDGWTEYVLELEAKDTAWVPGSNKWLAYGPGTMTYRIHPSGVETKRSETVRVQRTY